MKSLLMFLSAVGLTIGANASWSYDSSAKTITDGVWLLNVTVTDAGLQIGNSDSSGSAFNSANTGSGVLDFRSLL